MARSELPPILPSDARDATRVVQSGERGVASILDEISSMIRDELHLEQTEDAPETKGELDPKPGKLSENIAGRPAAAGVALHMHQPLMPAVDERNADLMTAPLISNLHYMMQNLHIHGNHDAPKFIECYERMGWIIPTLVWEGKQPRIMLEYSGCLLHGLTQLDGGRGDQVLRHLKSLAEDYPGQVEFLGAPWGHAVAPSTPPADFRLHVQAFKAHFSALFGSEAAKRLRCFSPSEMALPNDPDVAFEYIKTLLDCGYDSILLQEHTFENPETGAGGTTTPHIPHRLVCRNSAGQTVQITAIVKTQGSDTKLVGQMQPWFEARSICAPCSLGSSSGAKVEVPQFVFQISDGENGGVMMNEFPGKYEEVVRSLPDAGVPLMNVSEYLDHVRALGITLSDLPAIQPRFQKRIWELVDSSGLSTETAIDQLKSTDSTFHLEGGSWTNDISWVNGYAEELNKMLELSAKYWEVRKQGKREKREGAEKEALYHLMCSQTSCFRYWGKGAWTERGNEICRRGIAILEHDFE